MTRKIIFSIIAVLAVLLILESLSRLAESILINTPDPQNPRSGWQTEFFQSFMDWHQPDSELLWKYRANLDNPLLKTNSRHLLGREISQKKDDLFRILLLGDSSPVGLGLKSRQQAFGEILRYLLDIEYRGNKKFELVNAAVSGYTSEQIRKFMELEGWAYDPDLILVYCGNNDASISGFATDQEIMAAQKFPSARRFLAKLALYRILRAMMTSVTDRETPNSQPLKARVSPERYRQNLNHLADQCRNRNCPLIIIKPAVPYLWPAGLQFRLLTHITGDDGQLIFPDEMINILGRNIKYCLDRQRFRKLYGEGDIFTVSVYESVYSDSMTPQNAIAYYSRLLRDNGDDPIIYNNLGVSCWQAGDYSNADKYLRTARSLYMSENAAEDDPSLIAAGSPFLYNIAVNLLSMEPSPATVTLDTTREYFMYLDSALQADYYSLRIKKSYCEKIDDFKNSDGIIVIDLPAIFMENGAERLFIDHCHPTPEGHLLIAEVLRDSIMAHAIVR